MELGTKLVANMAELEVGWIRWVDKKPAEQKMHLLTEGVRYTRDQLGYDDETEWEVDKDNKPQDPWQETNTLPMASLDGEEAYMFNASSYGGRGAIAKLCKQYGSEYRQHPGEFPVIELDRDSYKHDDYGKIWFPVFTIVDWVAEPEESGGPDEEMSDDIPL